MMSPLLERHDYGICDQVERQMVELQNQGLLPEEMYNQNKDRIEDCKSRMDILQHRAKQQAFEISKPVKIGFVGFCEPVFDEKQAKIIIHNLFDSLIEKFGNFEVVSGLSDCGILSLVYTEGLSRKLKLIGIACEKGNDDDNKKFPVDEEIIVGKNWGDESSTFINYIDYFVRIGGGSQSLKEEEMARDGGIPVLTFELNSKAQYQAKKIHEEELSKTKVKNLLIKNGLYNVKDEHIVDVREYMSDGYSLDRAINQVVLDYLKKQKNKKQEIDKLWGV